MDLTIYDVIIGPHVTEKAYDLNRKLRQLVLEINTHANKPMVAEALRKLFNVEAKDIRIVISKGKVKRAGRYFTKRKDIKKAIITLKEGQSLDNLMGLEGAHTESGSTQ